MLIFNTTFHVENSEHDAYLDFIRTTYIPKALENGLIKDPALAKVHANHGETGVSYALQFRAESIEILNEWAEKTGENLSKELVSKFGNKVAGFATLLEEVEIDILEE
jgi:hypothetical protein